MPGKREYRFPRSTQEFIFLLLCPGCRTSICEENHYNQLLPQNIWEKAKKKVERAKKEVQKTIEGIESPPNDNEPQADVEDDDQPENHNIQKFPSQLKLYLMQLLQEHGKGKSELPMITGIIGFIATIPGMLCAGCMGACASAAETLSTGESSSMGSIWALTNLASSVVGMYYGIKSKAMPRTSGAVMIGVALLTLLLSFITLNWFWGLIAVACFAIGGAVSLTQDKTDV